MPRVCVAVRVTTVDTEGSSVYSYRLYGVSSAEDTNADHAPIRWLPDKKTIISWRPSTAMPKAQSKIFFWTFTVPLLINTTASKNRYWY